MGARIAYWLECQTHDRKVASLNPGRSNRRIFFSRVNFVCWFLFSVRSTPVLPQWHVKGPGHSAKSAGGRLYLNMRVCVFVLGLLLFCLFCCCLFVCVCVCVLCVTEWRTWRFFVCLLQSQVVPPLYGHCHRPTTSSSTGKDESVMPTIASSSWTMKSKFVRSQEKHPVKVST